MNTALMDGSLPVMLTDFSIDAIIAIDMNCTVVAWNTMAETMYGLLKADVLHRPLAHVLPSLLEDPETAQAIDRAFEGIKSFVPASRAYPHRLQVENHFTPLINERGILGVMNIVHDVAHRIKAEEQLQALNSQLEKQYRQLQQASDELASFTLISSSNIKQPIRHIYTAVENLIRAEAGRLTDSGKASFRRIQSSLSKMDLLLDDMLNLARISTLEKPQTLVGLNELFAEVMATLHNKMEEREVQIEVQTFIAIPAHRAQIQVLFQHLLDTAIRFSEGNKRMIIVDCNKEWASEFPEVALSEREYYRVSISYNGAGPADAGKEIALYEKPQADKYKNSGIGLAIARKIMNAHDGFMRIESNPDGHSYFHCFFSVNGY